MDNRRTLNMRYNLANNFWGLTVMTSAHLINRLPSKTIGMKSPIPILKKIFPMVLLKTIAEEVLKPHF